jgi:hypothetical protein
MVVAKFCNNNKVSNEFANVSVSQVSKMLESVEIMILSNNSP